MKYAFLDGRNKPWNYEKWLKNKKVDSSLSDDLSMDEKKEIMKKLDNMMKESLILPVNKIQEMLASDIVICAAYYLKYYYTNDELAYKKYYEMFSKLDVTSQVRVSAFIITNIDAQKNKEDIEMQKVKK